MTSSQPTSSSIAQPWGCRGDPVKAKDVWYGALQDCDDRGICGLRKSWHAGLPDDVCILGVPDQRRCPRCEKPSEIYGEDGAPINSRSDQELEAAARRTSGDLKALERIVSRAPVLRVELLVTSKPVPPTHSKLYAWKLPMGCLEGGYLSFRIDEMTFARDPVLAPAPGARLTVLLAIDEYNARYGLIAAESYDDALAKMKIANTSGGVLAGHRSSAELIPLYGPSCH